MCNENELRLHVIIRDPRLIAWLEGQSNRSEAVRQAIWEQITPQRAASREEMRQILREELARVAVVGPSTGTAQADEDVDAEAGALLDEMF